MNRTTVIVGGVIVALLIIGALVYAMGWTQPSSTATSTPTGTTGTTVPSGTVQTAGVPTVKTNPATTPSDTTVIVSGTVTPNGAFTDYFYEYGTTQSLGSKTANQNVGSGFTPFNAPIFIGGLTKNTTYFYRLTAKNQFGTVSGSTYTFQTTSGTPAPVGGSPSVKTKGADSITRTTATIGGEVTPNKASTTYWFEYGTSANLGSVTALSSVGNGDATLAASAVLANLEPSTTYFFRIDAQNQFGTVNGSIETFKTAGPAAVAPAATTRSATNVGSTTATLRGTVDPNATETKYWFEYSTDSLLGSVLLKSTEQVSAGSGDSAKNIEADVSSLNAKTNYFFRLVAQSSVGTTRGDRMTFKTK